jgi:uncharacterized protein (TIGR03382 family)
MKMAFAAALVAALAGSAQAGVQFSEILMNPPGTDQGQEFIELAGDAGFNLNGVWIIEIDGDAGNAGRVNTAINLSAFSLGSNGLFLARDTAAVLDADASQAGVQGPSPDTTLRIADFNPDIQNGSGTFLLVSGFTGAVGTDLDVDNNGVIDVALPWASALDGIGFIEDDAPAFNAQYATQLGFFGFAETPDGTGTDVYTSDALIRGTDGAWYALDVTSPVGSVVGAYSADANETTRQGTGLFVLDPNANWLTPGLANVIPTPGSLALLGLAGLAAGRRRRA